MAGLFCSYGSAWGPVILPVFKTNIRLFFNHLTCGKHGIYAILREGLQRSCNEILSKTPVENTDETGKKNRSRPVKLKNATGLQWGGC